MPNPTPDMVNSTPRSSRLLLHQMPPEMRNEIYTYLFEDEDTAYTCNGMPFAPKTYNVGRTTITLAAVHQGNASLLALRKDRFLDAEEYFSYIVPTAVTLRISIVVKGYMHKSEFASWKAKIEKHLHKLHSKYGWLSKVVKHDVRVYFDAPSTILQQIGKSGTYAINDLAMSMAMVLKGHQGFVPEGFDQSEIMIYIPAWMASALCWRHIDVNGGTQVLLMIPACVETLGSGLRTVLEPEKALQPLKIEEGKVEWVPRKVEVYR